MRDTADRLGLFMSVVEAGSFSEAGRRLGMTASAVIRAVDALEGELGARLINRSTRSLRLTEAGHALLPRARRIVADLHEARAAVSGVSSMPTGTLVVSASSGFGRKHVAPLLSQFLLEQPSLRGELRLQDAFIDLIDQGVDVAVRIGALPDSALIGTTLVPLTRILCASPDYLARYPGPRTLSELSGHHLLFTMENVGRSGAWIFRSGDLTGLVEKARLRASNPDALVAAAVEGLGIAHLPIWLVREEVADGRLVRLLENEESKPDPAQGIHVVWVAGRYVPIKTRLFVDFLKGRLQHSLNP